MPRPISGTRSPLSRRCILLPPRRATARSRASCSPTPTSITRRACSCCARGNRFIYTPRSTSAIIFPGRSASPRCSAPFAALSGTSCRCGDGSRSSPVAANQADWPSGRFRCAARLPSLATPMPRAKTRQRRCSFATNAPAASSWPPPDVFEISPELADAVRQSDAVLFDGTFWSEDELGTVRHEARRSSAMGQSPDPGRKPPSPGAKPGPPPNLPAHQQHESYSHARQRRAEGGRGGRHRHRPGWNGI